MYFPAVANAADRSHLSFRVAGEVSRVLVKEGDKVIKGDVIATLDPTDYQLDVDNASARFSVVDSQYRRSAPLVKKAYWRNLNLMKLQHNAKLHSRNWN